MKRASGDLAFAVTLATCSLGTNSLDVASGRMDIPSLQLSDPEGDGIGRIHGVLSDTATFGSDDGFTYVVSDGVLTGSAPLADGGVITVRTSC